MIDRLIQPVSTYASDIDGVILLIGVITGVWFLLTEGMFFWLIPRRKKRPAVDLCDFMDQIEGVTNKVRTPH